MNRSRTLTFAPLLVSWACSQSATIGLSDRDRADAEVTAPDAPDRPDGGFAAGEDLVPLLPDAGPGRPCNADIECGDGEYCDADYGRRVGRCQLCPDTIQITCPGGTTRRYDWGNGCAEYLCECPASGCAPTNEAWIRVDPSTIRFEWLPTGASRWAVHGYDPQARMCVTAIWDFSNNRRFEGAHCDDFDDTFPDVLLQPAADGACAGAPVHVDEVGGGGCIDSADLPPPSADLVDVVMEVVSPLFSGNIEIKNRRQAAPWPVSFNLRYQSDVLGGEQVYIQHRDVAGEIGWVRIRADGAPFPLADSCGSPICPAPFASCPVTLAEARDIMLTGSAVGFAAASWDGMLRVTPTANTCVVRQAAHPREPLIAEFCLGFGTVQTAQGNEVTGIGCYEVPFTMPTDRVELVVGGG